MESIVVADEMLKNRLKSINTLNAFCHESRHEIDSLNRQIHMKDSVIADLKARLGRYEGTCLNVEGEEPVVFGPSKSLLENLCKEISNLKQKLKDTETSAAQQSETSKLIGRLQQEVREKDRELWRIANVPQHQKDQEIRSLRQALSEQERARATGAVLCTSLAEEADQLRGQLGATVRVCQELLRRLERESQGDGAAEHRPPDLQAKEFADSSNTGHVNTLVCKLQEENTALKQRVAYVESLNAQWQKYDSSREEYVKGLCQTLKQFERLAGPGVGAGPGTGPAPASGTLLQQEIARLNRLLEEKMNDCAKLSRELEDSRIKNKERIQTLEQQVLIYTDDFKSERADRERAQSRIQDLQEEVLRLQQKLHKKQDPRDPPVACWVHRGNRISAACPQPEPSEPLLGNAADQLAPQRPGGQPGQGAGRIGRCGISDLQCPRCFTAYDEDHTSEYLKHCEECANL
ncbi:TNFAIP3-interacting protein 2 isoform X2 [Megalops cyprinoides]|uniref:TNFAIP3-interacting protein 2 isoform X2 n=1 Tax=Megalops cyprinoides TaxID=118141 RepID=UPI001863E130|nr:TNFAIP3-interacting protein 2 isoform X2 [Megalops cyprinoides]